MRAAQIESGTVINVILIEETDLETFGAIACPDECGPGWTYENGKFTAPPPPEPEEEPVE